MVTLMYMEMVVVMLYDGDGGAHDDVALGDGLGAFALYGGAHWSS